MNRQLLRIFVRRLYSCVGWRLFAATVLALVLAALQGTGILLLFPLLEIVGITNSENTSEFSRELNQWFGYFDLSPSLLLIITFFLVVVSVRELLTLLQSVLHATIQQSFIVKLRLDLFEAITYLDWLHFCRCKPAVFMQTLIGDISRIGIGTQSLITLVTTSLLTICYLGIALAISWKMTAIVCVCGLVSLLFLRRSFRKAGQLGMRQTEMNNNLFTLLTEHFGALRLTKIYSVQQQSIKRFKHQFDGMRRLFTDSMLNQAQLKMRFNLVSVVIFCFFLFMAIQWLMLSSASLLVLIVLFSRVIPHTSNIWQNYNRFCHVAPAFAAYNKLLVECREMQENRLLESPVRLCMRREIRFINIDFRYDQKERNILKALNFTIRAGELTAIVGPSGAGKSTIVDLIIGLLKPVHGEVKVDDVNLTDSNLSAWRANIAYVPQDIFLFNDTIRANIVWAKPSATDEEIQQCVRAASLEITINRLPLGLKTIVGDRGVCLSGGERQRIAIARALLRNSQILIFDEAMSELDPISQHKINQILQKSNKTIIVITHQLSTIKYADQIIAIEEGAVADPKLNSSDCGAGAVNFPIRVCGPVISEE